MIPVYLFTKVRPETIPLALGMIQAYAQSPRLASSQKELSFLPMSNVDANTRATVSRAFGPGIWLFSDYVWSTEETLTVSREVKERDPRNIVVHGGPSAPKYEEACRTFMGRHPEIDVIVRGEGEETAADLLENLASSWGGVRPMEVLEKVPGLTFRSEGDLIRTAERARIEDLNVLPSPFLEGLFGDFRTRVGRLEWVTLETNRGCPYRCAFCDWGSLTQQKIKTYDMARIEAEIEWIGRNQVAIVHLTDANFGILPRDVEIAEALARAKSKYGYPKEIVMSLSKNGSSSVREICRSWKAVGIRHVATFSIQSADSVTLDTISRTNIKTDVFERQIAAMEEEGVEYCIELMYALPGQTLAAFIADLQRFANAGVPVLAFQTRMLPNSPMAHPDYIRDHAIEVDEGSRVISTGASSREDVERMSGIYSLFDRGINGGSFRYILRYLQDVLGLQQLDVLERLHTYLLREEDRLPKAGQRLLRSTGVTFLNRVRKGERAFLDVLRIFVVDELGVPWDSAMETVWTVNDSVLPHLGRQYPMTVDLPHDFVSFHLDRLAGRNRPLGSYGRGQLVVEDRAGWGDPAVPFPTIMLRHLDLELNSPLRGRTPAPPATTMKSGTFPLPTVA